MEDINTPLVSIVIPAYNHGRYLEAAIQSVLSQDYQNIELIVLNDGSTDDTLNILQKYKGRFYWENQANMGQANTLNKGWQMSKGQILSYLSADDILLTHAVSTSVEFLKKAPDVVLTYCDFTLLDNNSKTIRQVRSPDFNYQEMFAKSICFPGPGVFMKREAFESAGLWNSAFRQMPDYDYWLRLGLIGKFLRIPQVLASFRVHEHSQTFAKADESKAREPLEIISAFIKSHALPPELDMAKNEALSSACLVSAQLHFRANRFKSGYKCLQEAFALYPKNCFTLRTSRIIFNSLFNRVGHKILRLRSVMRFRNN